MQQPAIQAKPVVALQPMPKVMGGLAVRTNLRAGLAPDDLDDQVKALWDKLTNAASSWSTPSATETPNA